MFQMLPLQQGLLQRKTGLCPGFHARRVDQDETLQFSGTHAQRLEFSRLVCSPSHVGMLMLLMPGTGASILLKSY